MDGLASNGLALELHRAIDIVDTQVICLFVTTIIVTSLTKYLLDIYYETWEYQTNRLFQSKVLMLLCRCYLWGAVPAAPVRAIAEARTRSGMTRF